MCSYRTAVTGASLIISAPCHTRTIGQAVEVPVTDDEVVDLARTESDTEVVLDSGNVLHARMHDEGHGSDRVKVCNIVQTTWADTRSISLLVLQEVDGRASISKG